MTPEQWQRARDVLHGAIQLEPERLPAYLSLCCGDDGDLREQVGELLEAEQNLATDFLESLPQAETALNRLTALVAGRAGARTNESLVGRRVGSFQIVEMIGSGGMGEVYRAFRADDQYRQEVAVKVVRHDRNSEVVIERFRNERQILADLDHPNIARLLDGGTTETGDPFFVMELIHGRPIDEYCDRRALTITERLGLFCQVCSAVEYAHRHLIVHRDIKPGNILVTADGVLKLLDFGIAKILGEPSIDRHETTLTMFRALTPEYASPEQVTGATITTATDVYSLGVVLYELLTGRSPYRLSTPTTTEMVRAVSDVEPERLSLAVRPDGHLDDKVAARNAQEIAAARQSSPEKLSKRLRGDIDNIVLMALRKEPQRRYASAEQFAQDIRWNLASLPVIARKDTLVYRTTKFVNRHKPGVLAGATVFLTLVLGIAVTLREAQIARNHQARAERNFNDVRALTNSLIFDIHDNIEELPGATKARKVLLDRALQYLDRLAQDAAGDEGLQRELASGYERLGNVQGRADSSSLGDPAAALQSYNKALILRQKLVDDRKANADDIIRVAQIHRLVADSSMQTGDLTRALDHARKAVEVAALVSQADVKSRRAAEIELARDYDELGVLESGLFTSVGLSDLPAALQDFEKSLAINSQLLAKDPGNPALLQDKARLHERVGALQEKMGRSAEGLQNLNVSMAMFRSLATGSNDASQRHVGAIASIIGDSLLRRGHFERALENFREELSVFENLSKRDPNDRQARADLTSAYSDVGVTLHKMGRFREALANLRRATAIDRELIALDSKPNVYGADLALHRMFEAEVLGSMGEVAQSLRGFEDAHRFFDELAQSDKSNLEARLNAAAADAKLGATFLRIGQYDEAQRSYRHAMEVSEQPATGIPPNLEAQYTLANAYSGLGDVAPHLLPSTVPKAAACREATSWYEKSVDVWNKITNRSVVSGAGFDVGDPAEAEDHLAQCKAVLEKLKASPTRMAN